MAKIMRNGVEFTGGASAWSGTQAEYDALPIKDSTTLYFITDADGSGHNYSTNEQVVGTWIDGSTIYEKTIVHTVTGANTYIDLTDLNIDKVIKMDALSYQVSSNNVISVPYCWDSGDRALMFYNLTNKHLTFNGASYNFGEWYITIRYTKSNS